MPRKFVDSISAIIARAVERVSFTQISSTIRCPQPSLVSRLFCLVLLFIVGSFGAFGQSQPNLENGTKPYGSYDGGSLDTVNAMNGNLLLHAPLLPDYPQRGKITPHYNLYVTSKGWQVMCKPASNRSGQVCWWQGGATGVSLQTSVGLTVHRTLNKSANGGTVTYQAYGYTGDRSRRGQPSGLWDSGRCRRQW
jgi:hypothetical protein